MLGQFEAWSASVTASNILAVCNCFEMRWYTVDYLKEDGRRAWTLLDCGFWLYDVPRLIPVCRLRGHRPVVDGVDHSTQGHRSRWVVCDRCGIRPDPQGQVDPDQWAIGQPYAGPFEPQQPDEDRAGRSWKPGIWPVNPTGTVGGQLVIGNPLSTGFEIKVGDAGSEHVLAAHVGVYPLGALYLHTESHGQGLQRRLNPTGYVSRVTGFAIHGGHLYWHLWAKRDSHSVTDPKWQQGSFRIDPRDILLGEARYTYEDVDDPVSAVVRMPHGDDHQVTLQLQRQTLARKRGRRKRQKWCVDIEAKPGIPTKPGDRGRILGFAVTVSDRAVRAGDWVNEACAEAASRMTRDRVRYGYRATPIVTDEDAMLDLDPAEGKPAP
jgi:hypothetical protein